MGKRTNLKIYLAIAVFLLGFQCTLASKAYAGSVLSWGETAFDSNDFVGSKFVAIAAGLNHLLRRKM